MLNYEFRPDGGKLKWQALRGVVVLLLAIGGYALASGNAWAETHHVQVEDFEFIPANLVIAPGDTVVWHANAPDHTVTADDLSFDSSPPPDIVTIPAGQTFSHTFSTLGAFHYYCRLHGKPLSPAPAPRPADAPKPEFSVPDDVMNGVIRVADLAANTPPQKPVNIAPADKATGLSTSPLLQASPFSDANVGDRHVASQWWIRIAGVAEPPFELPIDTANLTEIRVSGLSPSVAYKWQVRYQDDLGAWSDFSEPTQFLVAAAVGMGTGLKGTYFAYDTKRDVITKEVGVRVDPVLDFDWKLTKPHPASPANNFFIYWEGGVLPEFSEEYRFRIKADGGVRLWVNGQLVIDDFVASKFELFRSGTVALEAGIPAWVRIQYFDNTGNASMHLRWSSLSQPLEVIPQARLFPAP